MYVLLGDPGYPGPPGLRGESGQKGNHNTTGYIYVLNPSTRVIKTISHK